MFGSETVSMQADTGHCGDFKARHAQARCLLCHCRILQTLSERSDARDHSWRLHGAWKRYAQGKLPVVMPRARQYGEHINDHQILFTRALGRARPRDSGSTKRRIFPRLSP